MAEKIKMSDIRRQFPMYSDLSDEQLLIGLQRKHYPDMKVADLAQRVEFDTQRADPTEGGGTLQLGPIDTGIKTPEWLDRSLAGAGKAIYDIGRGTAQIFGKLSDADIAEARRLDAPLMQTGAGQVGNIAGNIATAIPTAFIPGANTLRGAALIGGVQGLLQPISGDEGRLGNVASGAGAGAGGVAAGRALMGAAQGVKAFVEPFRKGGPERIAGRMIQRFAQDPASIAAARGGSTITGATPTLAEATGDVGMARLQDALRSVDPQISNMIGQRLAENNAARVAALQGLAGDSGKRAAAEAAREAATAPQYQQAFAQTIDVTPELASLLQRPSVQKALGRASSIAKEQGRSFGLSQGAKAVPGQQLVDEAGNVIAEIGGKAGQPARVTGQTLQDLKMGMDALLKDPTSGIAGKEAASIKATRDAIVAAMEKAIPEFKGARTGYASLSRPLNAMDIGEELARRGTSNLSDLAGNPRMQANALLGMLRDEPALIARATGRKGVANRLADVLDPQQMATLNAVADEANRAAAVASAGAGPGSATAQRMASQNILRQMVGPTGLPQSWAESALANTLIGKPFNLLYGGVTEPKIQQALAEAVLNPTQAASLMRQVQPPPQVTNSLLRRLATQGAIVAPSTLAVTGQR